MDTHENPITNGNPQSHGLCYRLFYTNTNCNKDSHIYTKPFPHCHANTESLPHRKCNWNKNTDTVSYSDTNPYTNVKIEATVHP